MRRSQKAPLIGALVVGALVCAAALAVAPAALAVGSGGSKSGFVTMGPGVMVGKTLVGGLTPREATELVRNRFQEPLTIRISKTRKVKLTPRDLGARTQLGEAIRRAATYRGGVQVPLTVQLSRARIEKWAARMAKELDKEPVDARFFLRNLRPHATPDKPGRALRQTVLVREVVKALKTHAREPISMQFRELKPKVTRDSLGKQIIIRRESKLLQLFKGTKLVRQFPIATGQASFPTPIGSFTVTTKWANPWWYPPPSDWAKDADPVPPGPGNPLGTRWMGLSAPYIGIHGTPDSSSIGYSASHGCIRMHVPSAEWLFANIDIGTPVHIVAA